MIKHIEGDTNGHYRIPRKDYNITFYSYLKIKSLGIINNNAIC